MTNQDARVKKLAGWLNKDLDKIPEEYKKTPYNELPKEYQKLVKRSTRRIIFFLLGLFALCGAVVVVGIAGAIMFGF